MITLEKKEKNSLIDFIDKNNDFSDIENLDEKLKEAENNFKEWNFLSFDDFFTSTLNFKNNIYKNV